MSVLSSLYSYFAHTDYLLVNELSRTLKVDSYSIRLKSHVPSLDDRTIVIISLNKNRVFKGLNTNLKISGIYL